MLSFWFKKIPQKKKKKTPRKETTCRNSIRRGLEERTEFLKKIKKSKKKRDLRE
jgi:hypothetical protein